MNLEVNCGSLSLMILLGSPYHRTMFSRNTCAVSSAVIASLQGMKCVTFMQPWSGMVSMESYPLDKGNLVIKSNAMTLKGVALSRGYMGCRGAFVGRLLTLCR